MIEITTWDGYKYFLVEDEYNEDYYYIENMNKINGRSIYSHHINEIEKVLGRKNILKKGNKWNIKQN